jgi:hypothetical protein
VGIKSGNTVMTDWTTLLPRGRAPRGDVYVAAFLPKDWPGHGSVVTVLFPEGLLFGPDDVLVNVRPPQSGGVNHWLRDIFAEGEYARVAINFICNTPEQAEDAAKAAAPLLPSHERIALERLYAKACVRGNLS